MFTFESTYEGDNVSFAFVTQSRDRLHFLEEAIGDDLLQVSVILALNVTWAHRRDDDLQRLGHCGIPLPPPGVAGLVFLIVDPFGVRICSQGRSGCHRHQNWDLLTSRSKLLVSLLLTQLSEPVIESLPWSLICR